MTSTPTPNRTERALARDLVERDPLKVAAGEEFLTPGELCRRWRKLVTEKTLANWRSAGQGPTWTGIGGRPLYAKVDVESYEATLRAPLR